MHTKRCVLMSMNKELDPTAYTELTPSGRRAARVMATGPVTRAAGVAVGLIESVKINEQGLSGGTLTDIIESGLLGLSGLTILAGQRLLIRSRNQTRQEAIQ